MWLYRWQASSATMATCCLERASKACGQSAQS